MGLWSSLEMISASLLYCDNIGDDFAVLYEGSLSRSGPFMPRLCVRTFRKHTTMPCAQPDLPEPCTL